MKKGLTWSQHRCSSLRFPFLILSIAIFPAYICAQNKLNADIENRIKQVENNLALSRKIEGEPNSSLADRMKFYHANGVSIAVIKDYKIEWAKGYGWADSAEQRPVTLYTQFQAGSNSKSLNGVGVLKLVQEGKLELHRNINDYLKSWKFPYDTLSKGKTITLANLLSHTAGLSVHGFPGYEKSDTIPTLVQILNGQKPANTAAVRSVFAPSLRFQYSGGGTTISQLIVQDVTGQPYDKFMFEQVLKPMGMTNSSYTQPPSSQNLATGYYNDGKAVNGKYHIYPEQAAAGLWTTATDLAKYVIETQLSLNGKSSKVLSKSNTTLRLTPFLDSSAALGVFILNKKGIKYFNHGGVDEGFVSQYVGSLDGGNGVAVLANTYNTALLDEIINSVAITYRWENYYDPLIKKVVAVSDTIMQTYVGQYELRPGFVLAIRKEGNELHSQATGQRTFLILPEAENKFFPKAFEAQLEFLKNEQGVVDRLILHQGGGHTTAKKIK